MSGIALREPASGPLAPGHHRELAAANERAKKIRRAARVAGFNGWVTALFAVCSAPLAPFSVRGFLVAVGLTVIAYNEFQGRKGLLRFDPAAPPRLGWNQVAFMTLIIAYCLSMLFTNLTGEGYFAAELRAKPELRQVYDNLDELDDLLKAIMVAVYASIIVLSAVCQGLNALYYFTRRTYVDRYVEETPEWVLDLQRAGTIG